MKSPMYNEKRENDLKKTIAEVTKKIEENDSDAFCYYVRALQYYQLSQQYYDITELFIVGDEELYLRYLNCAYNDIEKALSFKTEIDDYAYSFKLLMLEKLKKWDELIEYGRELYGTIGFVDTDYALMGQAFYNVEDWENCIGVYSDLIEIVGEKKANKIGTKIFLELGLSYFKLQKYDLALKQFFKHKKLNPFNFIENNVNELIALTYEKLGKFNDAIKYFSKAINDDSEESEFYFNRGRIYCDYFKKFEVAIKDFKKAIKYAEEDNYFYYHNLGYASVWQGQIEEGKKDYKKALKYYNEAIRAYKKAAPIDPKEKNCEEYTVGYALHLKNELLKKIKQNKGIK